MTRVVINPFSTDYWLSLHTGDPAGGANEIRDPGYARQRLNQRRAMAPTPATQQVIGHDLTVTRKASEHHWQIIADTLHFRDAIGRYNRNNGKHRWWTLGCTAKGCSASVHVAEAELLRKFKGPVK
jgi:hypothetical protein